MIIGIGVDILKINRLKKKQDEIAQRILSPTELQYYKSVGDKRQLEFLSGRWVAKEAIIKASPIKIDINKCHLEIKNKKLQCNIKNYRFLISISHEDEYAIGYVICEDGYGN